MPYADCRLNFAELFTPVFTVYCTCKLQLSPGSDPQPDHTMCSMFRAWGGRSVSLRSVRFAGSVVGFACFCIPMLVCLRGSRL